MPRKEYGGIGPEGQEYKFLGKEIAYDDLLFRMLIAIANHIIKGEDATNLIAHLEDTFPYIDDDYNEKIKEAKAELTKKLDDAKDKYGHSDYSKEQRAIAEFTKTKYRELCKLFKRRKKFPQEAEEEWL